MQPPERRQNVSRHRVTHEVMLGRGLMMLLPEDETVDEDEDDMLIVAPIVKSPLVP